MFSNILNRRQLSFAAKLDAGIAPRLSLVTRLAGCAALLMCCSLGSASVVVPFNPDVTSSLGKGLPGATNLNIDGYVGNAPFAEDRTLLHFNISSIASELTAGYTVSALSLTVNSSASIIVNGDTLTPTIYTISNANAGWAAPTQSSWNNLNETTTTAWTGGPGLGTPGGAGIGSALASLSFNTLPVGTETFNFAGDLTGLLNGWLITNPGLIVVDPFSAGGGTAGPNPNDSGSYFEFDAGTAITLTATLVAPAVVPEPATGVMICAGLGALVATARKRRQS